MSSRSPPNTPPSRVWKNAFLRRHTRSPLSDVSPGMEEKTPVCPLKVHCSDCLVTKRRRRRRRLLLGSSTGYKSWKSGASPGQTVDDFNSWPTTRAATGIRIKLLPRQCQTFLAAVPAAAMLQVWGNYTFTVDVKIPLSLTLKGKKWIHSTPPTVTFTFQRTQVALFFWRNQIKFPD